MLIAAKLRYRLCMIDARRLRARARRSDYYGSAIIEGMARGAEKRAKRELAEAIASTGKEQP